MPGTRFSCHSQGHEFPTSTFVSLRLGPSDLPPLLSCPSDTVAYPAIQGTDSVYCSIASGDPDLIPPRREVYDSGRIFDITHRYVPEMPIWDSDDGLGRHLLWLEKSMKNGSRANNSVMKLGVYTGTHVDAPSHFFDNYFDAGFDVDSLDLEVLNDKLFLSGGHALLVDVPRDTNITGFKEDGAKWLVENTDIKLEGVDYLSAAAYDHSVQSHHVFLERREIILVEGLKLDHIPEGQSIFLFQGKDSTIT